MTDDSSPERRRQRLVDRFAAMAQDQPSRSAQNAGLGELMIRKYEIHLELKETEAKIKSAQIEIRHVQEEVGLIQKANKEKEIILKKIQLQLEALASNLPAPKYEKDHKLLMTQEIELVNREILLQSKLVESYKLKIASRREARQPDYDSLSWNKERVALVVENRRLCLERLQIITSIKNISDAVRLYKKLIEDPTEKRNTIKIAELSVQNSISEKMTDTLSNEYNGLKVQVQLKKNKIEEALKMIVGSVKRPISQSGRRVFSPGPSELPRISPSKMLIDMSPTSQQPHSVSLISLKQKLSEIVMLSRTNTAGECSEPCKVSLNVEDEVPAPNETHQNVSGICAKLPHSVTPSCSVKSSPQTIHQDQKLPEKMTSPSSTLLEIPKEKSSPIPCPEQIEIDLTGFSPASGANEIARSTEWSVAESSDAQGANLTKTALQKHRSPPEKLLKISHRTAPLKSGLVNEATITDSIETIDLTSTSDDDSPRRQCERPSHSVAQPVGKRRRIRRLKEKSARKVSFENTGDPAREKGRLPASDQHLHGHKSERHQMPKAFEGPSSGILQTGFCSKISSNKNPIQISNHQAGGIQRVNQDHHPIRPSENVKPSNELPQAILQPQIEQRATPQPVQIRQRLHSGSKKMPTTATFRPSNAPKPLANVPRPPSQPIQSQSCQIVAPKPRSATVQQPCPILKPLSNKPKDVVQIVPDSVPDVSQTLQKKNYQERQVTDSPRSLVSSSAELQDSSFPENFLGSNIASVDNIILQNEPPPSFPDFFNDGECQPSPSEGFPMFFSTQDPGAANNEPEDLTKFFSLF